MSKDRTYHIRQVLDGQTLAAGLRGLDSKLSWNDARRLIRQRRVQVNGNLVLDEVRRLKTGDVVKLFDQPRVAPPGEADVAILHVDPDLMVINKPPGITTLRHGDERDWDDARKQRQPTLDEVLQNLLPTVWPPRPRASTSSPSPVQPSGAHPPGVFRRTGAKPSRGLPSAASAGLPKVRAVHRLDRDTSGLMLFALSPRGEVELIRRFKDHSIQRVYQAVAHGELTENRRFESWFVRDRGDGLRGSSPKGAHAAEAQHAITNAKPLRVIGRSARYTVVECRLQTGRTHQIRIHLAEAGHMLCGEKMYLRPAPGAPAVHDLSGAPRQALHSSELEFEHPLTGQTLRFSAPLPKDLAGWLKRIQDE